MRKSLIITIAAALLLCAVLCTAGCVSSDPVVGDWVAETNTSVSWAVFENGGTGYFAAAAEKDGAAGMLKVTFNWTADGGSTYTLAYGDGATETAVLDAQRGLMTIGDVVYEKEPSELSGTSKHQRPSGSY